MPRPAHEVATNLDGPTCFDLLAKTGTSCDDEQHAFEVQADRTGSRSAVLSPPLRKAIKLADSASLDDVREGHGYP